MQTTPTFDALVSLVERRNRAIVKRDELRGTIAENGPVYCQLVGEITGIQAALEALRDAGEQVASAEYIAAR